MSIAVVETPTTRSGPATRTTSRCERMWSVRRLFAPCRRRDVDENAPAFEAHREGGHAVLLEAGLADAGAAMEFPAVPWTDDVIAVEPALAQRPTDMIARIRKHAVCSVAERNGDVDIIDFASAQRCPGKFVRGADIDPMFLPNHDVLQLCLFVAWNVAASHRCFGAAGMPGGSGRAPISTEPSPTPHRSGSEFLGNPGPRTIDGACDPRSVRVDHHLPSPAPSPLRSTHLAIACEQAFKAGVHRGLNLGSAFRVAPEAWPPPRWLKARRGGARGATCRNAMDASARERLACT